MIIFEHMLITYNFTNCDRFNCRLSILANSEFYFNYPGKSNLILIQSARRAHS